MLLAGVNPNRPDAAAFRARLLMNLRQTPQKDILDGLMTGEGYRLTASGLIDETVDFPSVYWARWDQYLFIFADGLQSRAQAQRLWDGYVLPREVTGVLSENLYLRQYAQHVSSRLGAAFIGNPSLTYLTGYSAGGAMLGYLQRLLASDEPNMAFRTTTFGSPKAAGRTFVQTYQQNNFVRWMNTDDAVPLIPPTITTWQRFWAGLSIWEATRLAAFVAGYNGIVIELDGRLTPGGSPVVAALTPVDSVVGWMAATQAGRQTPHSIQVYAARLAAYAARVAPAPTPEIPVGQPVPEPAVSPRLVRDQVRTNVQTIFSIATRQNQEVVRIPDVRLFRAVRLGKVWHVEFGGTIICISPFKKRARGLARIGNEFLRRIQNEAVVNPSDLAEQFTAYLALASDPSTGFRPTLNTTIEP